MRLSTQSHETNIMSFLNNMLIIWSIFNSLYIFPLSNVNRKLRTAPRLRPVRFPDRVFPAISAKHNMGHAYFWNIFLLEITQISIWHSWGYTEPREKKFR